MYQTNIFFLEEPDNVRPIPQHDYVSLVRGEKPLPAFANKTVRVADWYIKTMDEGRPEVENETYSVLKFDANGFVEWPECRHGIEMNHAFYKEIDASNYVDIDGDPNIQKLRKKLRTQFTWLPNSKEREAFYKLAARGKNELSALEKAQ